MTVNYGVEIIPMPWEIISSLPRDESWKEIIDHCFEHDPLPWRKNGMLGCPAVDNPRRVHFGTDHCYTYDQDIRSARVPGAHGPAAFWGYLGVALYQGRVFSSAGERLPDTEEAGGSTPLTPTSFQGMNGSMPRKTLRHTRVRLPSSPQAGAERLSSRCYPQVSASSTHSPTDRASDYGSENVGSIPAGCT
jgi:hypothetical protein